MLLFATLLDISDALTKENFIDLVIEWNESSPYAENIVRDVAWKGERHIKFGNENLFLEILDAPEEEILAVRHEKITKGAIVWDTDFIVNFRERKISVRLDRTYSEDALKVDAGFSTPHFLSLLIKKGFIKEDHGIPVLRDPIEITDADADWLWDTLVHIEQYQLPVIYVAKDSADRDPVSTSWLASKLKGAAHVLVEKDKASCAACSRICGESQEEFGAVRIYYPSQGMERRRFLYRSATGDAQVRLEKIIENVIRYRNAQRVDSLYTWPGISRAVLHHSLKGQIRMREAAENAWVNAEEEKELTCEILNEDIRTLQERLEELSRANEALQMENIGLRAKLNHSDRMPVLYQGDEEDFYPEEIRDVLLSVLTDVLGHTEKNTRRYDVLEDILENNEYKHLGEERKQKVKNLFRGYKNLSAGMRQEFEHLGCRITEDGKHYKFTYHGDPRYMVTIGKTPSDNRAGSNNAALMNRIFF